MDRAAVVAAPPVPVAQRPVGVVSWPEAAVPAGCRLVPDFQIPIPAEELCASPSRAAAEAPFADYMNQQGHYFEVVQGDKIYFVHKKFVSWIEELV